MSDAADESKAIRDDISFTRAKMGDELEEIGARLNPRVLAEEGKEKVRETALGWARRNPVLATAAAVGVIWLLVRSARRKSSSF